MRLKIYQEQATTRMVKIEDTTDKTLVHVNDQYSVQLRFVAELARTIANGDKATDADRERATEAERVYNENRRNQEQAKLDQIDQKRNIKL